MVGKSHAKWIFLASCTVGVTMLSAGSFVAGQSDANQEPAGQLLREGTHMDSRPAVCRFNGQRLSVEIDGLERPLVALENLAAQRILDAIRDDPGDNRWLLDGKITEFLGTNYLLLEHVKRTKIELEH